MRLGDFHNTVQPLRRGWPLKSVDGRHEFRSAGLHVLCYFPRARLVGLAGGAERKVELTQHVCLEESLSPAPLTVECGSLNHIPVTWENATLDDVNLVK